MKYLKNKSLKMGFTNQLFSVLIYNQTTNLWQKPNIYTIQFLEVLNKLNSCFYVHFWYSIHNDLNFPRKLNKIIFMNDVSVACMNATYMSIYIHAIYIADNFLALIFVEVRNWIKLHWSDVLETIAFLGIIESQLGVPWNPRTIRALLYCRVWGGSSIQPSLCRETLASRTADVIFPSLA